MNGEYDGYCRRRTDDVEHYVAQGSRPAGHKVLVKLIRAGVEQAECRGAQRRQRRPTHAGGQFYAAERLRKTVAACAEAGVQKHVGEVAYAQPEDYDHFGSSLTGRNIYAQHAEHPGAEAVADARRDIAVLRRKDENDCHYGDRSRRRQHYFCCAADDTPPLRVYACREI